jgi:hypothetical protein
VYVYTNGWHCKCTIYSVLVPISEDTGLTLADLNAGTGYMFLLFVSPYKARRSIMLIRSDGG